MKKSFISEQAKEFRTKYNLKNSQDRFLEAEGSLFRDHPSVQQEALKELADLVYVCYQYAENMGWFLDEALDRVHKSNMSKLGEDGKPIYREDGKVLKGPNYKLPDLTDLF
jgi:predicted HAD superfamily Cof-like phosphohydrolase